jgi:LPXTG-motif cell wall-anchored protein
VEETENNLTQLQERLVFRKMRRYRNENYQGCDKEWPEQEVSSDQATKGKLSFSNITIGYYELEESEPPAGYVKTGSNPRFKVTEDEDGNLQVRFTNTDMVTYESGVFKVENTPGAALPNTGGSGTTPYTVGGSLMLAFTALAYIFRRRRFVLEAFPNEEHPWKGGGPRL